MARPTKLTPEVAERIVNAVRAGNYYEPAARSAGISPATFHRWIARGKRETKGAYYDFYESVERASAEAQVHAVALIKKAAADGEWRAAAYFLERRHPEGWRRHESIDHEGSQLIVHTEELKDPKTRKELREITRRVADAREKRPRRARTPE
ncbi:MAG: transposase [Solirubrobacterales bacterium]